MPNGVKCQRAKTETKTYVGMARGPAGRRVWRKTHVWVPHWTVERLNSDGDALKQECRLARIACCGIQTPTHISEKIQRARSYALRVSSAIGIHKENSGGDRNTWPRSEIREVLRRQQRNELRHGGKTGKRTVMSDVVIKNCRVSRAVA